MTESERTALSRCPLFEGLTPDDVSGLLACLGGYERRFRRGEALWRMGDAVSACAVVLSGGVRAESVSPAGEWSVMAVHGAGALVGDVLMAARDMKSPVDVIAAQDTAALFLPYRAVMASCRRACERHTRLRENLLAEIAEKYWRLRRRSEYLARRSLRSRIAAFLLDAAADAGGNTFSLGMRREDLAGFLGVNRSALCRELSRLRTEGWIDCCRDSVRLLNTAALAQSASAGNRSG